MKRFIDLKGQIPGVRLFAFYCTKTNSFETFSGNCTWSSAIDFKADYEGDNLRQYLELIPEGMKPDAWADFEIRINGRPIQGMRSITIELPAPSLESLQEKLEFAEACENYEACAKIRDQINNYKNSK